MCARHASVSFAICQVELNWTVTPTTDTWHSAANVELTSFLTNQGIDTNKWLHRLWLTLRDLPSTKSQHFMSPVFNPLLLLSSFTELAFMGPNRSLDQVADAQSLCAVELAAPIHMESQCRSAVVQFGAQLHCCCLRTAYVRTSCTMRIDSCMLLSLVDKSSSFQTRAIWLVAGRAGRIVSYPNA